MRVDRLITELPPPKKQGSNAATALQEISGGKYGKMIHIWEHMFQSCNFRSKDKLRPFYSLVALVRPPIEPQVTTATRTPAS